MNSIWQTTDHHCTETIDIIKSLWKRLKVQSLLHQTITLFVIAIAMLCLTFFYSSFLIWQAFYFVMTKLLLKALQWYLLKDNINGISSKIT